MRDEYPKTKKYLRDLSKVRGYCMDIITGCSKNNAFPSYEDKMISECENIIEGLFAQDANVAPGVWPVVIQELLDSVDYSNQLQTSYDGWIKILGEGVWIESDDDIQSLLKRHNINPEDITEESRIAKSLRLLKDSRSIMFEVWNNIQELKLEYNLYDNDDYNLYPAFKAFFNKTEYPNRIDETATKTYADSASIHTEITHASIGNDIIIIFKDEEVCEEYFNWEHSVSDAKRWGQRFNEYGKGRKKLVKGDLKKVFDQICTIHSEYGWEKKDLEKFRKAIII